MFDNDKDLKQTDQDGSFLEVHNPKSQAVFVMVFPVKNDPNSQQLVDSARFGGLKFPIPSAKSWLFVGPSQ